MGMKVTVNRQVWDEDEDGYADHTKPLGFISPASDESVREVLLADEDDGDGRSQFFWLRLNNGDLMLACFPQGNTYFATENDHS